MGERQRHSADRCLPLEPAPHPWLLPELIYTPCYLLLLLLQSAPSQLPSVSQFISSVFGYEYSFRGWCLLIVLAYVVFFRVLGIIALRYVSFLKR